MRKVVTGAKHPVAAFFHLFFKVRGRLKRGEERSPIDWLVHLY